MPAQTFEAVPLGEPLNMRLPSLRDMIVEAHRQNPLYFDEPIRSEEVAKTLGVTLGALASMHHRGSAPKSSTPAGSRRRLYTRRSLLEWLYSDDPVAQRKLKSILKETAP